MKPPRIPCALPSCPNTFVRTRKDRRTCSPTCKTLLWRLDPTNAQRQRETNQAAYWKAKRRRGNKPAFARD